MKARHLQLQEHLIVISTVCFLKSVLFLLLYLKKKKKKSPKLSKTSLTIKVSPLEPNHKLAIAGLFPARPNNSIHDTIRIYLKQKYDL